MAERTLIDPLLRFEAAVDDGRVPPRAKRTQMRAQLYYAERDLLDALRANDPDAAKRLTIEMVRLQRTFWQRALEKPTRTTKKMWKLLLQYHAPDVVIEWRWRWRLDAAKFVDAAFAEQYYGASNDRLYPIAEAHFSVYRRSRRHLKLSDFDWEAMAGREEIKCST